MRVTPWPLGGGGGREELKLRRFSADPTRIYRMPEDQVAKRGTTVQLECRVKHDPSLKLAVSWLKDDEPLYISNRSPLLPPCLLRPGALPSPLILVMCGRTRAPMSVYHCRTAEEGSGPLRGDPLQCLPSLHSAPCSSLLFRRLSSPPPLLSLLPPPFLPLLLPSALSFLSLSPSLLLFGVHAGCPPPPFSPASSASSPDRGRDA